MADVKLELLVAAWLLMAAQVTAQQITSGMWRRHLSMIPTCRIIWNSGGVPPSQVVNRRALSDVIQRSPMNWLGRTRAPLSRDRVGCHSPEVCCTGVPSATNSEWRRVTISSARPSATVKIKLLLHVDCEVSTC